MTDGLACISAYSGVVLLSKEHVVNKKSLIIFVKGGPGVLCSCLPCTAILVNSVQRTFATISSSSSFADLPALSFVSMLDGSLDA